MKTSEPNQSAEPTAIYRPPSNLIPRLTVAHFKRSAQESPSMKNRHVGLITFTVCCGIARFISNYEVPQVESSVTDRTSLDYRPPDTKASMMTDLRYLFYGVGALGLVVAAIDLAQAKRAGGETTPNESEKKESRAEQDTSANAG